MAAAQKRPTPVPALLLRRCGVCAAPLTPERHLFCSPACTQQWARRTTAPVAHRQGTE